MASTLKKVTLDDVKALLGRALLDSEFRKKLLTDPDSTLVVLGYESSTDSGNFFRALNSTSFKAAADEVENRLGGRPVVAAWL